MEPELPTLLRAWFRENRRDLPWRGTGNPYAVWVSEMMLQQTQVATVIPYFERWMARFPTLETLAAAEEQDVLHAWQGLGYYSRARNLLKAARAVVAAGGGLPSDPAALQRLPGIGPYTAGAIASIAHGVRAPLVDGNVIRVLTRLYALDGDPSRAPLKQELWRLAESLLPEVGAGQFNEALMELGATVCTPVAPRCAACPWEARCLAHSLGAEESYPQTAPRPAVTAVNMSAAVLRRGDGYLLVQRPPNATRWAGMWGFPAVEHESSEPPEAAAVRALAEATGLRGSVRSPLQVIRHTVTRYRITLRAFVCVDAGEGDSPHAIGCAEWAWVTASGPADYALPAAHRKIAAALSAGGGDGSLQLDFDTNH